MQNSKPPETQRFSQEMTSVADGEPTFCDLDIIGDRSRHTKLEIWRDVQSVSVDIDSRK